MANEAHVRIDEGIKRGKRRQVNRMPRASLSGQYLSPVTPQRKQQIIQAALVGLAQGLTTDQIGEANGITGRALRYWLLDDEQAEQARRSMINQELARTGEDLRQAKYADSPLPLACAREEARYWMWIAERREARLYGPKQEVTHLGPPPVLIINAPIAAHAALPEKLIESVAESDPHLHNP